MVRLARSIVPLACLVAALGLASTAAYGQDLSRSSASASTRITAVVHGSISVNVKTIPLRFDFDPENPEASKIAVPLVTNWNVNPREVRSVEVVGYFTDPSRALVNDATLEAVPASSIVGRVNSSAFGHFEQSYSGTTSGSLLLLSEQIDYTNSRRTRSDVLELMIDPTRDPELSKSTYTGSLTIEVRQL